MTQHTSLLRRGCLAVIAVLLALVPAGANPPALAAPASGHTYIVNSTLDEPDADPANGVCASTPSGKCTLRAAIMESIIASGPNTIILPGGTYSITRPGYDDNALVGDYDIANDLTLLGAGSGATIVDGNGAVSHDRVFQILNTAHTVTLSGLTIRGGLSLSSTVGIIGGGGIYMEGTGHLHLSDVILAGNTGQNGGGIYLNFAAQGGSAELDHVDLRANGAVAGGVGAGGGMFAYLQSSASAVDIHDSQIYSNTADGTGGGLFVDGHTLAQWTIERSQIYSNTAAAGGGIGNFVPLTMADSRLHDNRAAFDGGAIEAFSPYTITRTSLETNTAGRFGGGIFDLDTRTGTAPSFANITQSTFSGNYAQYGGGIYHDGFIYPYSRLTLINSTLSGNGVFRRNGATGSADGGGLYQYGGVVQLFFTTIAGNRVQLGIGIHQYPGVGGGVYITATAVLTADNSIIADNVRGNGITVEKADDCYSNGTTGELAYDLILSFTSATCSVNMGGQIGNIFGQDPLLGSLQDNGGSTPTRALLPGSPAIGAGAPAFCEGDGGAPVTTDQRGAPRPASHCDIGAYQVVPEADLLVTGHGSANPNTVGAPLTYTLAVTNHGPVLATGIMLTDTLPAGVTLKTVVPTQGNCSGTGPVVCSLLSAAAGSTLTVTVAVIPMRLGQITNRVTATANEFDPAFANNTASQATNIGRQLFLPLVARVP